MSPHLRRRVLLAWSFGLFGPIGQATGNSGGEIEIETGGVQIPQAPPATQRPPQPSHLIINGQSIPRDMVFRFLPIMLPLPTIRVTSLYGLRRHPLGRGMHVHHGIDFAAPMGTPVFTTAAGVVAFAGSRGEYGLLVEVTHGLGFVTRYGHLSRIEARAGQIVDRHTRIGQVGATGAVTGPHLHYEIRHNGVSLNPVEFILRAHEAYRHL